ncbi:MAG TPA: XRE family transcriptional regulator [Candidatus Wolfebacteria bacterium]|nr:XRE family transcriptional regulator [Candidatus Wolfebacteria bacterium]
MNKNKIKKIANSFNGDLAKDLKNPKFKKTFNEEMLKLQIAEQIIALRKKRRLTQKDLAKKINTTQAVVSRIENAQVYPSTIVLQRICNKFNVNAKFEFCEL